jgi:hypothetical protein
VHYTEESLVNVLCEIAVETLLDEGTPTRTIIGP